MIEKVEMYTVVCDHCQLDIGIDNEYSCWNDDNYAEQNAEEEGWLKIKDGDSIKHYCDKCWSYDAKDNLVLDSERKDKFKMEEETITPFSNGTEFMVWQDLNCCQCSLYENESTEEEEAGCKLAYHLDLSCISGELPKNIADEIGLGINGTGLNQTCSKIQKKRIG